MNLHAKKIPILENRSAQEKDFVDIHFEGTLSDNTPLPNGSANNFILELGSQSFIPGFEEGIEGMKPEEEKILNVTFPEDYHAKDIAGQNVSFKIKLNKIMKKSLPELTDEFVISLKEGNLKTVEELKAKIRDNIEESEKIRIKNDLHEKVLKTLVENNPIELPPSLINRQKEALKENSEKTLAQQGLGKNEIQDYYKKWDDDFAKNAKDTVHISLLIEAIVKKENLQTSIEEVDQEINKIISSSEHNHEDIKKFYNNPENKDSILYRLTEKKVIDFVTSHSTFS